jgi:ribosome recycling factor
MIDEKHVKEEMKKKLDILNNEFKTLNTGRASPSLLDAVKVDVYGALQPLKSQASISAPEPRLLLITPFAANMIKDIMKGIENAKLGFNPQTDGKVIRINIPAMTEERRKEFAKKCKEMGEKIKIQLRAIRADYRDKLKKLKDEIPKDTAERLDKSIQKMLDDTIREVEISCEKKEKEIMTI